MHTVLCLTQIGYNGLMSVFVPFIVCIFSTEEEEDLSIGSKEFVASVKRRRALRNAGKCIIRFVDYVFVSMLFFMFCLSY